MPISALSHTTKPIIVLLSALAFAIGSIAKTNKVKAIETFFMDGPLISFLNVSRPVLQGKDPFSHPSSQKSIHQNLFCQATVRDI